MSTSTKATHTPGPWRYLPLGGDACIRGPKHKDGSSILVAVMGEHIESPDDARLIAAAPEMLEALEMAVAYFSDPDDVDFGVLQTRLDDAIEKATGKRQ